MPCMDIRVISSQGRLLGSQVLVFKVVARPKRDQRAHAKRMGRGQHNASAAKDKAAARGARPPGAGVVHSSTPAKQMTLHAQALHVVDPHVYTLLKNVQAELEKARQVRVPPAAQTRSTSSKR